MRVVVFSSYDKTGTIHEYVLNYLRCLKEVADKIIFIADNTSPKSEQDKLKNLVDYAQFKRHGEYDFGSYKRGIKYADEKGWLGKTDELILCNDSCFCVRSFKLIFEKIKFQECDFWGLNTNNEVQPHLQSFFLVFKKKVFTSKIFQDFIKSIQKQPNVQKVIFKYEIPLKVILNKAGFKDASLFEFKDKKNPTVYHNLFLLKAGYPLLKKKVFTNIENAAESRRKILKEVQKINVSSYHEICDYYHALGYRYFPWILPTDGKILMNFLYQKKEKSSHKHIVKICKLPVFSISRLEEKTKYRILFFKFSISHYSKLNFKLLKQKIQFHKTTLFFDMYLGGGTNNYFKNYIMDLSQVKSIIRIQNTIDPDKYTISFFETDKKYRMTQVGLEGLFNILKQLPISKVIISNLISWKDPLNVLRLIKKTFKKNIPISLCVHDYFSVCPFYTLMKNGRYCGGAQKGCEKCFLTNKGSNKRQKDYANQYDISTWRQSWGDFLQNCVDEIVVFSESGKKIILQAYPKIKNKITIVPHKVPYLRPCHILPHEGINICVVGGAMEDAKGMYILRQMEKIIAQKMGVNLIIVGCYDKTNSKTIVTGIYERDKLPDILEQYQGDVVMLPSIAPETFSYVTSEGMMMGLPVACFNIGAPVERVSKYKKGLIISKIDAQVAVDEMVQYVNKGRE